MTATRDAIESYVRDHPGVHFNAIVRETEFAPGQVQYHLRRLVGEDLAREEFYGQTHYYPPAFDRWERGAIALLRRETARDVLAVLLREGPTAPADAAGAVGVARSTLEWHLDHLIEQDLVRKERDDRGRVTLHATRPRETARLLDVVTPSLPRRMVDRFTRLVDDLLEGEE